MEQGGTSWMVFRLIFVMSTKTGKKMMTNNIQGRKDNAIQIRVTSWEKMLLKNIARREGKTVTGMLSGFIAKKIAENAGKQPVEANKPQ